MKIFFRFLNVGINEYQERKVYCLLLKLLLIVNTCRAFLSNYSDAPVLQVENLSA